MAAAKVQSSSNMVQPPNGPSYLSNFVYRLTTQH